MGMHRQRTLGRRPECRPGGEGQDIRATIGATVEPVAPRDLEPDIWEDYVSAYENGRFAESTRFVRSYPDELPVLRDLLPAIRVPVHVFAADGTRWCRRPTGATSLSGYRAAS
jgi:hypothetical protein